MRVKFLRVCGFYKSVRTACDVISLELEEFDIKHVPVAYTGFEATGRNYTTVASDSVHLRNMISSIVFSNERVCQLSVRARGIYKVLV